MCFFGKGIKVFLRIRRNFDVVFRFSLFIFESGISAKIFGCFFRPSLTVRTHSREVVCIFFMALVAPYGSNKQA